jgi:hypothetical protein
MPTNDEFLPMSLVTFSKDMNEQVYLLYSKGFEQGPGIHRNGQGSPWMIDAETLSRRITDPHEQRKAVWLINSDAREFTRKSIPKWTQDVNTKLANNLMDARDAEHRLAYYQLLSQSVDMIPDYHSEFERLYTGRVIVGMQGCGNLSMNEWYVAYVRSPFTNNVPTFIALPEDRIDRTPPRQYTCLVKYNDGKLQIETLVFNFLKGRITSIQARRDITDEVEFAVYGTQVLRNGELVDFSGIVEQIADVRHLFKLPNLNPPSQTSNEPTNRPRRFFGERQYDDVWFGEAELLKNLAMRRAALSEPVLLNRQFEHMGADPDYIREIFGKQGYREYTHGDRFLRYSDGSWRFREETDELAEVKLFRNVYAYSLLGLDGAGNALALAVGGLAGRRGQTLESAVQNIRAYGAVNALLMDQGDDVFQYALSSNGQYEARVRFLRPQMRAVFVFAAPHGW